MICFPHGKINLGLAVTEKRPDGYHNLETVFYPVPFCDALEILPAPAGQNTDTITITGHPVEGDPESNLCIRAVKLLRSEYPELPYQRIYLHKVIPMGAGLGGGSADGTFTLTALNKRYRLGLSPEKLIALALQLGSDCPFFVLNQPAAGAGRGEILRPLPLDLSGYTLVLVNPGIHVSTAKAFSGIHPARPVESPETVVKSPVAEWKDRLINDFEATVFPQFPRIAELKEFLYRNGAVYAAMSGTGSTVFGLFDQAHPMPATFPANCQVFSSILANPGNSVTL